MSEAKHTPGQLFISAECPEIVVAEDSVYGVQVADCGKPDGDEYQPAPGEGNANAARIVLTWNSHDELLAALKELLRVEEERFGSVNSEQAQARLDSRRAIAKAEGH